MKLYNPFKPHIVETDSGKFAIREFSIFGFVYWDIKDSFKWGNNYAIKKWCLFDTFDEAKVKLQKYYNSKKKGKIKVVHL